MSLYRLIGRFLRRHSFAYAVSAAMLVGIALLLVWFPGRSAPSWMGWWRIACPAYRCCGTGLLVLAGTVVYFLRVGWRLKLYAAAYRLGVELRERLYTRLALQGDTSTRASAPAT